MIIKHSFNPELSSSVYNKCKHYITPKGCYINVFHMISRYPSKFRNGEWKVAYGYIKILPDHNLMARHCFIVNSDGEAVDPTLITNEIRKGNEEEHYSFFIFDNVESYLQAIEDNDHMPDLIEFLTDIEAEFADTWAKENDYFLVR